ncbi:MAG: hypothetical protein KGD63_01580 [Candidatus Lokiarchaeota archaeon]|nr:hypothetical protein [Candidatus Lokiarchaeota archaeon]
MNYSRNELLLADAAINQLRNAIYHLARFMVKNGKDDLKERLQRMGKNIARTYIKYWNPAERIDINNIKDVIITIYKKVLKSSVSVDLEDNDKLLLINDLDCALCKYKYDDIQIAGCEILLGFISEFINIINIDSKEKSFLMIEPVMIQESKAFGNKSCIQIFKYKIEVRT